MLKEKVTSIIAIILLATLVGLSYWYSVKAELEGLGHLSDIESPEFVTHNTTVTKFDENGVAKAKIFAKYAEHYSDGHAKATFPEYWSLTPGQAQISATADRGEMTKGGEMLHFYGNVDLRQAAYGDKPASRIQTDQLDAFPDTDTYTTDHYVILTRGDDVSTGMGADFDKVEHTFKLRSRVATTLQPKDKEEADSKKQPAKPKTETKPAEPEPAIRTDAEPEPEAPKAVAKAKPEPESKSESQPKPEEPKPVAEETKQPAGDETKAVAEAQPSQEARPMTVLTPRRAENKAAETNASSDTASKTETTAETKTTQEQRPMTVLTPRRAENKAASNTNSTSKAATGKKSTASSSGQKRNSEKK